MTFSTNERSFPTSDDGVRSATVFNYRLDRNRRSGASRTCVPSQSLGTSTTNPVGVNQYAFAGAHSAGTFCEGRTGRDATGAADGDGGRKDGAIADVRWILLDPVFAKVFGADAIVDPGPETIVPGSRWNSS